MGTAFAQLWMIRAGLLMRILQLFAAFSF